MTKEEIFACIKTWQEKEGEYFFELFQDCIDMTQLAYWCLGKGYINQEQMAYYVQEPVFPSPDILVGYEYYSIVNDEEDNAYEKGDWILAEFLATSEHHAKILQEFVSNIQEVTLQEVIDGCRNPFRTFFYVEDGERKTVNSETQFSLSELSSIKWYQEDSGE